MSCRLASLFAILAAVSAGCANPNPSRPGAVIAASPATAPASVTAQGNGATQLHFSAQLTVPPFPTCGLTPPSAGTLTGTGVITVLFRNVTDGNGGTHIGTTIHGHGTVTDATGATWVWSDADLNNTLFPSGNTTGNVFEQTITEAFHVIGPKGEHIIVKGVFHITVVGGTTVVEFEKGNHEDNEACESGFVLTPIS